MEEQKTGKSFIICMVFAFIGLIIYLAIHNNWFNIDYYLSDVPDFDADVVDNIVENRNLSFVVDNIPKYLTVGEYTDFTVIVVENGEIFKSYTGAIIFFLIDEDGNYLDPDYYVLPNNGWYDFKFDDNGKKDFIDGLRVDKAGKYTLFVESLFEEGYMGRFDIVVQ